MKPAASQSLPVLSGNAGNAAAVVPTISASGATLQTLNTMIAISLLKPEAGVADSIANSIGLSSFYADIAQKSATAGITLDTDEGALVKHLNSDSPFDTQNAVYSTASVDGVEVFTVYAGGSASVKSEFYWLFDAAGVGEEDQGFSMTSRPLAQDRLDRLVDTLARALAQSPSGIKGLATYQVNPASLAGQAT